jgi:hypothetical protein
MNTINKIKKFTKEITDLLIEKNTAYGDSATNPKIRVFGNHLTQTDAIRCRIDDKLNRIHNIGLDNKFNEDTLKDLIGYLILLYIAEHEDKDRFVS